MLHGSCLCGGVKFVVERDPLWSHHCHCSRCRKSSGSAFNVPLIVPLDAVRFIEGKDLVSRFELPGSEYATNFCRTCGSSVPAVEPKGHPVAAVPMGSLDDDPDSPPIGHIYVGSKAPWHTIADDLVQAEEMPTPEMMAELHKRI